MPVNFDGFNRGTVTIRQALTESLEHSCRRGAGRGRPGAAGGAHPARACQSRGCRCDTAPSLAVGLGGVGVTLRDLVSIYAAIAAGRHAGGAARRRQGTVAEETETPAPVLDPVAAWYVANMLARRAAAAQRLRPGRIAYKTGTSYGYRDAWAIGFDGETVIGVWVGRPDNAPVPGITGIARGGADPVREL